jgi:histidinol phosphatase-like PHP family hydrolase
MNKPTINTSLGRAYMGGLAHIHTRLSNYAGHHDSNQTLSGLMQHLEAQALIGSVSAPFQFLAVTEHSSNPQSPRRLGRYSLRARALMRQQWLREIDGVPVFYGFEANLLPGGETDLAPQLEANCELVIGSRHWLPKGMEQNAGAIEKLLLQACTNPAIDVIGHPARGIEYLGGMDWAKLFDLAVRTGTAIEVNLNNFPRPGDEPGRTEFWFEWINLLGASGALVFLGNDLHNDLQLQRFAQAWAALDDTGAESSLSACLRALVASRIGPERVVTSSLERLRGWLGK